MVSNFELCLFHCLDLTPLPLYALFFPVSLCLWWPGIPWLICLPAALFSAVDDSTRSPASHERLHKSSLSMAGHGTALSSLTHKQKGG